MNAQRFTQLKVGDRLTISQTSPNLANVRGQVVEIYETDFGNNRVLAKTPTSNYYVAAIDCDEPLGTKGRFDKAAVEEIRRTGGNKAIRDEMTPRINAARNALVEALKSTPKDLYNEQRKIVTEQLRQADLLHKMLQK